MDLKLNAVNQIVKDTVIYSENQPINSICLILKGRITAYGKGTKRTIGSGNFIGVSDLFLGRYLNTYIAYDNLMIYVFDVKDKEDIGVVLSKNKDYHGLMVATLNKAIADIYSIHNDLVKMAERLYHFLSDKYSEFKEFRQRIGFTDTFIPNLDEMEAFEDDIPLDDNKIKLFAAETNIPLDVLKAYYSYGNDITMNHVVEQSGLVVQMTLRCMEISGYLAELFPRLIGEGKENLFCAVSDLAFTIARAGGNNTKLLSILDDVIEEINKAEDMLNNRCGVSVEVDRANMEKTYYELLTGEKKQEEEPDFLIDIEEVMKKVQGSLKKILSYSEIEKEKAVRFEQLIMEFKQLKDKMSTDDGPRKLRREITDLFYQIYERVFLKADSDPQAPKIIELFLNFGYMDETLLSREQIGELYYLKDNSSGEGKCKVYTVRQWLTEIYKGRKEPSKSEFDMDYQETIRTMKKEKKITEEQSVQLLDNNLEKLKYEIKNMFRYNNRVVNGQISVFIPVLHYEQFGNTPEHCFLTTDKVNLEISKLKDIDFSVFYREIMYTAPEKGIEKEYVQMEVFPDIILLPTYGTNAVMWQEISGKRHASAGRFLLPIFAEGDLSLMLVKVLGRFRWELCRTLQGSVWNNIKYKSLTSEYSDYIQFYRKNRELSEEKKEKLKMQIQKAKNNMREIFCMDYQIWIMNESEGAVRLNKVARGILGAYCPFNKETRVRLEKQPLFQEALERYERERLKKVKELDIRYRTLQNNKIELTNELIQNQCFYTEK